MAGSKVGGLTPKRRAFVKAYLGEAKGNATLAAKIAGYAQPMQEGCRLLRIAEVARAVARRPERPDIADPDEVRAIVTGILRSGEEETKDRLKAADVLTKILPGLAVAQKVEHTGADGGPIRVETLTDEQLDAELAAATAVAGAAPSQAANAGTDEGEGEA